MVFVTNYFEEVSLDTTSGWRCFSILYIQYCTTFGAQGGYIQQDIQVVIIMVKKQRKKINISQ